MINFGQIIFSLYSFLNFVSSLNKKKTSRDLILGVKRSSPSIRRSKTKDFI